jgi:lactoylglutathione lyase
VKRSGFCEARALDELVESLADHCLKDPVKVELREARLFRDAFELQRLGQVTCHVVDLPTSLAFYQKLGFEEFAGTPQHGWVMLRNGNATIGLFQGMFERNMLTFNPGWNADGQPLPDFTDVRELQRRLAVAGIDASKKADESSHGPESFIVVDPDGNPILVDQHV